MCGEVEVPSGEMNAEVGEGEDVSKEYVADGDSSRRGDGCVIEGWA